MARYEFKFMVPVFVTVTDTENDLGVDDVCVDDSVSPHPTAELLWVDTGEGKVEPRSMTKAEIKQHLERALAVADDAEWPSWHLGI
jgi:hypothetical protein